MSTTAAGLDPNRHRERWNQYRAELIAHYSGEFNAAKKLYATFAPVFFAVSLAFLKDLVNLPTANHKWMIFTSWGCFIVVIALTLGSHITSGEQALKQFRLYDDFYAKSKKMLDAETDSPEFQVSQRLRESNTQHLSCLRNISGFLFLAALVMLVVFIGENI
jgi:hypothetical protein